MFVFENFRKNMSFEAILSSIISLGNQYLTKTVDTGDKLFDTSVLAILTTLLTLTLRWIYDTTTSVHAYNKLKYKYRYYIKKQRDPMVFRTEDYKYDLDQIKKLQSLYINAGGGNKLAVFEAVIRTFIEKKLEGQGRGCLETNNVSTNNFDGKNVFYYSSNGPNIPLFYDGVDMVYGNVSANSFINILYADSKTALSKFLAYIHMKIQEEETKKMQDKTEDKTVNLYDYSPDKDIQQLNYKSQISPGKRFEYIFYDQKQQLVSVLEKFKEGCRYPPEICMDNKLGILLYGPPGTGKTGTISAIANMLQRSVILINFTKITKRSQLDYILADNFHKDYIYVFDEFDCILDVLVNKQQSQTKINYHPHRNNVKWTELIKVSEGEDKKKMMDMMMAEIKESQTDERIDMAYLLSKFDGLESSPNRLIIATTNHPEHINPVLLRPGRFDLKLELGNCSQQMYQDILKSYFKLDAKGVSIVKKANLPTKKWSPLQVINTALVTNDLQKTLKQLAIDE